MTANFIICESFPQGCSFQKQRFFLTVLSEFFLDQGICLKTVLFCFLLLQCEFCISTILPYPWVLLDFQFSSVAQSCPTLCDPMNHSTPGLPVHHQLPEFTQTHVHRVGDAIQPSHPLSPFPPAPNPSQHQSLFQ